MITDAAQDFDQTGRAEVTMSMNGTGARIWKNLTGANVGRRIAIVLDGYIYSAPVINGEIPGVVLRSQVVLRWKKQKI